MRLAASLLQLRLRKRLVAGGQLLEAGLVDLLQNRVAVGMSEKGGLRRRTGGRLKRGGEVAANRAAPGADVGLPEGTALLVGEQFFEELQHGGMVEDFRADVAAAAPGRSDDHGDAVAQADGAATRFGGGALLAIAREGPELDAGIDARRDSAAFGTRRIGRGEGRHVIEVAVVLVVGQDEDRLLPNFGLLREDAERLGEHPGSVPGRTGMIGTAFGRNQPGDRGELALRHIAPELKQ